MMSFLLKKINDKLEAMLKEPIMTLSSKEKYKKKRSICLFLSIMCLLNLFAADRDMANEKNESTQALSTSDSFAMFSDVKHIGAVKTTGAFNEVTFFENYLLTDYGRKILMSQANELLPIVTDWNLEHVEVDKPTAFTEEEITETDEVFEAAEEVIELTNEDKIKAICEKYGMTREEFQIVVAVVIAESEWMSYEDVYAAINTIYNRSISSLWIYDVDKYQGEGKGTNMYNQIIQQGQFDVYWLSQSYLDYMDATPEEYPAMQLV